MKANSLNRFVPSFSSIILWGCFLLFLMVTFVSMWKHEPWIDEIWAWQISRYSVGEIIYEMRYEGHFLLWYLVLFPFSHLGMPLKTLGIISWSLNAMAIFYFLKRSPFKWWAKLSTLIVFPFLYDNPCISRSYVLIPLLIFPLAYYYLYTMRTRDERCYGKGYLICGILLSLLSNTHIYIEGFVGIVSLILFVRAVRDWKCIKIYQRRMCILSFFVIFLGLVMAFIQVYPSLENSSVFLDEGSHGGSLWGFFKINFIPIRILQPILLLLTFVFLFLRKYSMAIILFCSCLFMAVICLFVYDAGIGSRSVLWFYCVLFCLWIICYEPHKKAGVFHNSNLIASTIVTTFSILLFSPWKSYLDYIDNYSSESVFAYFIKDHINPNQPIYATPCQFNSAIVEYLPEYEFINLKNGDAFYPRKYRDCIDSITARISIEKLFEEHPEDSSFYIMDGVDPDKEHFMGVNKIPYKYDIVFPDCERHVYPVIHYYLFKVYRDNK